MSRTPRTQVVHTAAGLLLQPLSGGVHGARPKGPRRDVWAVLMACAADADAPEVRAAAGVLATSFERYGTEQLPLAGLDAAATRHLLARWFPGADQALGLDWQVLARSGREEPRYDEIEDLLALLTESSAAGAREETLWLAHVVAQASLGDNHLWQDLRLPSRRELSLLMVSWFPTIAARNDRNMKWKKFLYKQLCDRAELSICRAPTCGECADYAKCYGPEDAVAA